MVCYILLNYALSFNDLTNLEPAVILTLPVLLALLYILTSYIFKHERKGGIKFIAKSWVTPLWCALYFYSLLISYPRKEKFNSSFLLIYVNSH